MLIQVPFECVIAEGEVVTTLRKCAGFEPAPNVVESTGSRLSPIAVPRRERSRPASTGCPSQPTWRPPMSTLSIDVRNQPAWRLYRSLGFEPVERRAVHLAVFR